MSGSCSRDGCEEPAGFSAELDLQAGALVVRYRLLLCPGHAEELPWLVRLRESRNWDCGLLLEQVEQEVV